MGSIKGAIRWNDRQAFYVQTNNPTEMIIRRIDDQWLQSCGPTAAVMCCAVLDLDVAVTTSGGYQAQPEEILMDALNDPRSWPELRQIRKLDPQEYAGNEVPQYYPWGVSRVFGATARFVWEHSWRRLAELLKDGHAVQLCLEDPGHYIAAVAYDSLEDEVIYHDPWPARFEDNEGFARRMDEDEYRTNVKPYMIVYGGDH
jgi:hypothetical protein